MLIDVDDDEEVLVLDGMAVVYSVEVAIEDLVVDNVVVDVDGMRK